MVAIEARPYEADMTDEERAALLSRVFVIDPGILFFREIPVQSVASIDLMLRRACELVRSWPSFVEVLDLSDVHRPSAEVRNAIRGWMKILIPTMTHMAIIVRNNYVMRAVARFVAYSMHVPQMSFHETEAEALEVARRARR